MSKNRKIIGLIIGIAALLLIIFTLYGMSSDNEDTVKIGYELGTDLERIYEVSDERDLNEFLQNEKGKCLIYGEQS